MRILKLAPVVLVGLVVLLFALIGLLSLFRGTPVSHVGGLAQRDAVPAPDDPRFARLLEVLTGASLSGGNEVTVLTDGAGTFPLLFDDIRRARASVTVQVYYGDAGRLADSLAAALLVPARAGVPVLFLYDAFGAGALGEPFFRRLRAGGVRVAELRPVRFFSLHKAQERGHTRAVVIDGRVGYTGGFGIADAWLGAGRAPGEWRETNVRLAGPAVDWLQAAFIAGWAEATGQLITGAPFVRGEPAPDTGGVTAAVLHTVPATGSTAAERLLALSVAAARRTLWVTNAYFVPDDDFRRLLVGRARAGVDVRVLAPGERTDIPTVRAASRAHYEELLLGGVRIWEYQPSMMHAKTLVADGVWSVIGTMNFDNRSLALNDETVLLAHDPGIGATMDSLFLADLRHAREIELDAFRGRGLLPRLLEKGALLLSRLL